MSPQLKACFLVSIWRFWCHEACSNLRNRCRTLPDIPTTKPTIYTNPIWQVGMLLEGPASVNYEQCASVENLIVPTGREKLCLKKTFENFRNLTNVESSTKHTVRSCRPMCSHYTDIDNTWTMVHSDRKCQIKLVSEYWTSWDTCLINLNYVASCDKCLYQKMNSGKKAPCVCFA